MKGKWVFVLFVLCWSSMAFAQKTEEGLASFYADKFVGRKTANGETYHHAKKTAAHPKLPFGTIVKVTNIENQKHVIVRINDRGPFKKGRIIDLSKSAANELGFVNKGLARVKVEVVGSLDDFDEEKEKSAAVSNNRKSGKTSSGLPVVHYKVRLAKKEAKGFGIQIGSFREFSSAARLMDKLPENYRDEVLLQVEQHPNGEAFKVIVGPMANRFAAEDKKSKLKPAFPGCFIVEW
jgi:rare lipoprotein A